MSEVKGYEKLSETKVQFINELKEKERDILAYLFGLDSLGSNALPFCPNARWLMIARNYIEQGFMAAVRSVAQGSEGVRHE